MYLTKVDYKGRISAELLDMLLADDEELILSELSKTAEDTIQSMAGMLYEVAPEFQKTLSDRNYFLLGMAKNIALYNLYQKCDDEQIPEKIVKNYDDTIEDLIKVSIGKMTLNLPPKDNSDSSGTGDGVETATTTGNGLRRMGSQPKRTHNI